MTVFPGKDSADICAATRSHWTTTNGVPLPAGDWLHCPICDSPPQARWWQWHTRPAGHTIPWRCDISFKCTGCAMVWFHGIALTKKQWQSRPFPGRDATRIKWREVKAVVDEQPT